MGPGLNDSALMRQLLAATDAGRSVVLVTVVASRRSVPRRPGSKMLVFADRATLGTIGGGEMEARVVSESLAALADGKPRTLMFSLVDPDAGDPGVCGGEVDLYLEPHMSEPTIYVIGCGHVGRAVVDLAHWMGFRVVATDDRAELATPEALPLADVVVAGSIDAALTAAPITSNTDVVVVTRNVAVDLELLPVLAGTAARSIGVMGSTRRWHTTADALRARGVPNLDRFRSPIGIELGAETPEEIAVSIMAEIVASRRKP